MNGYGKNPYLGILAHADCFIVTGDSVNMVSEAIATGKPVHVFKDFGGSKKFDRFHTSLEKLGVTKDDFEENKKSLKRKSEESTEVLRQQQKLASMKSKIDAISKSTEKNKSEKVSGENPLDVKKFKESKDELDEEGGADTKNRREELLKQLRAVEKAIHKKRSKLDK